ncbi:MAG: ABC transporter substrate-binding protein [Oscillospiraceae bacterium]|nr:ABC transporter substrate-binding protein [Oscillospiraceae bacterium]
MKRKKTSVTALVLIVSLAASLLCSCGVPKTEVEGESVVFEDDCGRKVTVPADISRIAPSGIVAQMILTAIAPDLLAGLSSTPGSGQLRYLPEYYSALPTFGQFYGSKATLNMESLLAADAQVIIDLGDRKKGHAADMNRIQKQCGIPTVFLETTLDRFADAYRRLGRLLGREERGELLAAYVENTVETAKALAAKIPEDERLTVMYGSGTGGLNCNARGSVQADVIELVGGINAIVVPEKELSNAGGGNTISYEQLYNFDPDVILLSEGGPYSLLEDDPVWSELRAVKEGRYYEIPCLPYNWMSNPPSVNRILGIWWLGNLLYPEVFDYDVAEKAMEFYSLFYNAELTRGEAEAMLANSSGKRNS